MLLKAWLCSRRREGYESMEGAVAVARKGLTTKRFAEPLMARLCWVWVWVWVVACVREVGGYLLEQLLHTQVAVSYRGFESCRMRGEILETCLRLMTLIGPGW